jgi:outer membrane receptor protein involved in Fe transport
MALLGAPRPAFAQSPTGTLTGRITDSQGKVVPAVTVTVESPSLQQPQKTTSSSNGDYIVKFLPPGEYTVRFELTGFTPVKKTLRIAAAEPVNLDARLEPAARAEAVTVIPEFTTFLTTTQQSISLPGSLLGALPTSRTMLSAVNLAPAVHQTGPDNAITIAGAMSFENVFLVNGVPIQDNVRGQPFSLFIEDAIQETTVSTSGISAEFGRFSGGVVNTVTKSGSNRFSGSWRTNLANDNWRSVSPYKEPKVNDVNPVHEFTLGGPIVRDRLWFFAAGRNSDQKSAQQTGYTDVPYQYQDKENRGEVKLTASLAPTHRVEFSYIGIRETETNNAWPGPESIMDLASLTNRDVPENLTALHYTGSFGRKFFVEGQYSARTFAFQHDGGLFTDVVRGTPLRDQTTGAWWSAPNFCGVCTDERRDNDSLLLKGTYFASTGGAGSHSVTFGYDNFNDKMRSDNHQSASDYHVWATGSIIANGTIYPVLNADSFIVSWPLRQLSKGTNFRTHSLFVDDAWALNNHWSFNLGVRFDQNRGHDSSDALVANDHAFSPRLGLTYDVKGNGNWVLDASYSRYVSALANTVADSSSAAGNPAILAYFYEGAPINTGKGPYVSSEAALQQVFNWYNAVHPDPFFADIPGLVTVIDKSLVSPHTDEVAVGVSHPLGSHGAMRVSYINRSYADFYATRTNLNTGIVADEFGQEFDRGIVQNTNDLVRTYRALDVQAQYRLDDLRVGGTYTLSKLHGNINGETSDNGPITSDILQYPEYFDRAWSFPEGDLRADQRHRARIWATYPIPWERLGHFSIGVLEQVQSGTPYGAVGSVDVGDYKNNPGYALPPSTNTYYFTPRDEFRTATMARTDVSINFERSLAGNNKPSVFAQFQFLNIFNQFQAFNEVGINETVLTAVDDPDRFAFFNPFTTKPVQGLNWDYGDKFGKPIAKSAYTTPRLFRMSVGLRF